MDWTEAARLLGVFVAGLGAGYAFGALRAVARELQRVEDALRAFSERPRPPHGL